MIVSFLRFAGTNPVVLGVASVCGIAGFILTIIVAFRTAKISRILQFNSAADSYNKQRQAFQNTFNGHRASILEDDNHTDRLLKDILTNVESYDSQFHNLLSLREKWILRRFKHLLKKPAIKVNFIIVSNYLAALSGRLSKREEKKRG